MRRYGIRGLHKCQKGLAAVEMALIFPIVVIFIFLTMDTGLFFYDYVSAANALREGGRCGAVGYDDASVVARVVETSGFSAPVDVVVDRTGGQLGDDLVVTGTFSHEWLLPAEILSAPTEFTRSITMRLETDSADKVDCGTGV
ncbi:MAG: TadE family protein [Dehalococcoidia bacterium]